MKRPVCHKGRRVGEVVCLEGDKIPMTITEFTPAYSPDLKTLKALCYYQERNMRLCHSFLPEALIPMWQIKTIPKLFHQDLAPTPLKRWPDQPL
jgi:hypothetical protein